MGNTVKIHKINFEDVQSFIQTPQPNILFINTLPFSDQQCLIYGTFPANQEESEINRILQMKSTEYKIIIYGKNSNDESLYKKFAQLHNLGFHQNQIFIYMGGLFEWLLLQDIYGHDLFPTTKKELDILKYKPAKIMHT
jgi:hypothetical protein